MCSVVKEKEDGLDIDSLHDYLRVSGERTYIRFIYPTEISIKNKSTKTLFSWFTEVSHQMASNREGEKASID